MQAILSRGDVPVFRQGYFLRMGLSLKTQRVAEVIKTYEGQIALQALMTKSWHINVMMSEDRTVIIVTVDGFGRTTTFSEPFEDFPSDTLKAQITLLCG